ncbi:site-specific DNA-methyltransferase [Enterococcus thailandicus]|uniref:site-specific DNA-methyltransferase n=1 Tax=Bacilli TaxID=91061 RepID=UPI0038FC38F1
MSENVFNDRPHKNEKDDSIAYVKILIDKAREEARKDDIPKLEKLIQMLNTKKYGLVWEEHTEKVEEEMKTKIPVFIEDASKKINDKPDSEDFNFLLEGDNLHSLHLLEKTHAGKIDVIYIDPPYNTGSSDWRYNNDYVDKTDEFKHSKWISFMTSRLKIAKKLLKESGFITVAIDEKEIHNLRHILDDIFGENNKVGMVTVLHNPKGRNQARYFSENSEFFLVYAANAYEADFQKVAISDEIKETFTERDEKGAFRWENYLRARTSWSRQNRPNNFYPIYVLDDGTLSLEKFEGATEVFPSTASGDFSWKNIASTFSKLNVPNYFRAVTTENGDIIIQHKYYEQQVFKNVWIDKKYQSEFNGTNMLKKLFDGKAPFNFSKSVYLVQDQIKMLGDKNALILDFFAGSGTTGQAVIELNAEDGGSRKFILATNNENNIAEEVTYERMKRVSTGTEKYEAHPLNLKYFKTDFVVKEEFPDISLEYELLKYVTPLVELEFGIDITNPKVQIVLNEEQLELLINNKQLISDSTLFIHPDVFRDAEQNQILQDLQIKVQEIPNYFFGTELWTK